MFPRAKVLHGTSKVYTYNHGGTYITSGKPTMKLGGRMIAGKLTVTPVHKLVYPPMYVTLYTYGPGHFGAGVCGKTGYKLHLIQVWMRNKFFPVLTIKVQQGWIKTWHKPWKCLSFYTTGILRKSEKEVT